MKFLTCTVVLDKQLLVFLIGSVAASCRIIKMICFTLSEIALDADAQVRDRRRISKWRKVFIWRNFRSGTSASCLCWSICFRYFRSFLLFPRCLLRFYIARMGHSSLVTIDELMLLCRISLQTIIHYTDNSRNRDCIRTSLSCNWVTSIFNTTRSVHLRCGVKESLRGDG